jgi:hypothetical protein
MNRTTLLLGLAAAVSLGLADAASAQERCFAAANPRPQQLVGLHETVRLSAACEYALTPSGPWLAPGALAGREADFLEIHEHVRRGAPQEGDPRVVLGRPRTPNAAQQSLMLRYCAHYLLEEQLGLEVVPMSGGGTLRIQRRTPDACGAAQLELRAVRGARNERVYGGQAERTLGTAQSQLDLPEGDWSLYAARPGSTMGLRVGVFRPQRVVTPLAQHLRAVGLEADAPPADAPALLAARWDPGAPGLMLHPTEAAVGRDLLWPELRTASDAGFVWLADARGERAAQPRVIAPVQLEAGGLGALRLPDGPVRDHMRATYGAAGDALAPDPSDWRSVWAGLAVCLTPSYRNARPVALGAPVPDPTACASLAGLTVIGQAQAARPARVCLAHGRQIVSSREPRYEPGEGEPECLPLPPPGATEVGPRRVAVVGDRLRVEGDGLCVTLDNRPLTAGEGGELVLDRSGLLEVRQSGGEGCTGRQALARWRLPVIDPTREWHPVGLYAGATEAQMQCAEGEGTCPWRALAHDEAEVFAYVRSRHELAFRLSSSPAVAAALGADAPVQLTTEVPLLAGVRGRFEGPRESAVVAWPSRDAQCPDLPYGELRARPPLEVDALMPDAQYYVHLLAVDREDAPAQCLARAGFRVRPSRAVLSETVEDFLGLEVGLLGDTQLVFFGSTPLAMGFSLPLVWFRLTPGQRWVSFDVGGNLVMAAAFPGSTQDAMGTTIDYPAQLSRLGVSLSWALTFGVPDYAPRLLSVGGMLHGAAETHSIENPVVSFFVGLNLATLIDLAGGR